MEGTKLQSNVLFHHVSHAKEIVLHASFSFLAPRKHHNHLRYRTCLSFSMIKQVVFPVNLLVDVHGPVRDETLNMNPSLAR